MRMRRVGAGAVLSVAVLGAGSIGLAAPAGADTTPSVSVNPNTGLTDGQSVTVTLTNFTDAYSSSGGGSAFDIECSAAAMPAYQGGHYSFPEVTNQYCDSATASQVPVDSNGNGNAPFTVLSSSYTDTNGDTCDTSTPCDIVAADNPVSPLQVEAAQITFASASSDLTPTTTKVSISGQIKAGRKITATAKTTPGGSLSGTVKFFDNGKKVAAVKEKSSGKVSHAVRLVRGKNKIVAKYSGNSTFSKSSGHKTVT